MFGKLTDTGILGDSIVHLLVSAFIAVSAGISLNEYSLQNTNLGRVAVGLATIVFSTACVQALYHIMLLLRFAAGVMNRGILGLKIEELEIGEILRNLLTTIGLVSSVILYAVINKRNEVGWADDVNPGANTGWLYLPPILFFVMRLFDTVMNGKYADGIKVLEHTCKNDEEKLYKYFTPRIIGVHLLLAASATLSIIEIAGEGPRGTLKEGDVSTVNIVLVMIIGLVHLLLYPFSLCLPANVVACCSCGDKKECTTGEQEVISLNRVPLIRSIVAGAALIFLSFAFGNALEGSHSYLLMINLACYIAADQIGFDVV